MISASTARILLVCIAFFSPLWVSCVAEPDPPPYPTDLDQRNKALRELEKQLEVLSNSDLQTAENLLSHGDYRVRRAAALRIMDIGRDAQDAVSNLVGALQDIHPKVRTAAARALAEIGDENAVRPLILRTVDAERPVRRWVWKSLLKLKEPSAKALVEFLGSTPEINMVADSEYYTDEAGKKNFLRDEIIQKLPLFEDFAIPALIEGLESTDDMKKANCAYVLGRMGPEASEAIPKLVEGLEEENAEYRYRIVQALGEIGDLHPSVMPALNEAVKDNSKKVAKQAKKSIEKLEKELKEKQKAESGKQKSQSKKKR